VYDVENHGIPHMTMGDFHRKRGKELLEELHRMFYQNISICLRFIKIIPGIVTPIIMKENITIQATQQYFEQYCSGCMKNGKGKHFPFYNQVKHNGSCNQVKNKEKVCKHRKGLPDFDPPNL
jgi:hypothetical protein